MHGDESDVVDRFTPGQMLSHVRKNGFPDFVNATGDAYRGMDSIESEHLPRGGHRLDDSVREEHKYVARFYGQASLNIVNAGSHSQRQPVAVDPHSGDRAARPVNRIDSPGVRQIHCALLEVERRNRTADERVLSDSREERFVQGRQYLSRRRRLLSGRREHAAQHHRRYRGFHRVSSDIGNRDTDATAVVVVPQVREVVATNLACRLADPGNIQARHNRVRLREQACLKLLRHVKLALKFAHETRSRTSVLAVAPVRQATERRRSEYRRGRRHEEPERQPERGRHTQNGPCAYAVLVEFLIDGPDLE